MSIDVGDIFSGIAKSLGAVVPTVANLVLPGSGPMLAGIMRAVTGDDDTIPIEQVAAKIQQDPALMVELRGLAVKEELGLAQIDLAKAQTTNETMRAESISEHWPQYSWRPYNGFLYGSTMFVIVVGCVALPLFDKAVPDLTAVAAMMVSWSAILGVQISGRNKEKHAKVSGGTAPGMLAGLIGAIRK